MPRHQRHCQDCGINDKIKLTPEVNQLTLLLTAETRLHRKYQHDDR